MLPLQTKEKAHHFSRRNKELTDMNGSFFSKLGLTVKISYYFHSDKRAWWRKRIHDYFNDKKMGIVLQRKLKVVKLLWIYYYNHDEDGLSRNNDNGWIGYNYFPTCRKELFLLENKWKMFLNISYIFNNTNIFFSSHHFVLLFSVTALFVTVPGMVDWWRYVYSSFFTEMHLS